MDFEYNYSLVPLSAIVHSLFVFREHKGGESKHFCSLPKINWSRYFNSKINAIEENVEEEQNEGMSEEEPVTMNMMTMMAMTVSQKVAMIMVWNVSPVKSMGPN
jgi:hypothetical protein